MKFVFYSDFLNTSIFLSHYSHNLSHSIAIYSLFLVTYVSRRLSKTIPSPLRFVKYAVQSLGPTLFYLSSIQPAFFNSRISTFLLFPCLASKVQGSRIIKRVRIKLHNLDSRRPIRQNWGTLLFTLFHSYWKYHHQPSATNRSRSQILWFHARLVSCRKLFRYGSAYFRNGNAYRYVSSIRETLHWKKKNDPRSHDIDIECMTGAGNSLSRKTFTPLYFWLQFDLCVRGEHHDAVNHFGAYLDNWISFRLGEDFNRGIPNEH